MDNLPTPEEVGIKAPTHVKKELFEAGFQHSISGGQLNKVEYFKKSFRLGFRAGRLYLKEVRRAQGIIEFPIMGKIKTTAN